MRIKRILTIILALTMIISLIGCGNTSNKTPDSDSNTKNGQTEEGAWVPEQDFTIRVPFAAGGVLDTVTRIVAQGLQKTYNKTAVVTNLTGANGAIAANDLLSQKPNATDMMSGGIGMFTLAPLFNKEVKMNLDDYKFVAGLVSEDFILTVNPSKSGIKSWEDFVEYGKDRRLVFGSNPPGGTTHMLATALLGEAGLQGEAVTSSGTNKDLLALLAGDVDFTIATESTLAQHLGEDAKLLPIAVFSEEPYTDFEGYTIPTVKSLGYDIVFRSLNFLMTRAEVDQAAVDSVYNAIQEYYKTDEFKEMAGKSNYTPDTSDGVAVRKTIEDAADLCKTIFDKYYAK